LKKGNLIVLNRTPLGEEENHEDISYLEMEIPPWKSYKDV